MVLYILTVYVFREETFVTVFINRYRNGFLPLLWQFFIPNRMSLRFSEPNVLPPAWISSVGI